MRRRFRLAQRGLQSIQVPPGHLRGYDAALEEAQQPQPLVLCVQIAHLVPQLKRRWVYLIGLVPALALALPEEPGLHQLPHRRADPLGGLLFVIVGRLHLLHHLEHGGQSLPAGDGLQGRRSVARQGREQPLLGCGGAVEEAVELLLHVRHLALGQGPVQLNQVAGIARAERRHRPDLVPDPGLVQQLLATVPGCPAADHLPGQGVQALQGAGLEARGDPAHRLALCPLGSHQGSNGRGHEDEPAVLEQTQEQLSEVWLFVVQHPVEQIAQVLGHHQKHSRSPGQRLQRRQQLAAWELAILRRRPLPLLWTKLHHPGEERVHARDAVFFLAKSDGDQTPGQLLIVSQAVSQGSQDRGLAISPLPVEQDVYARLPAQGRPAVVQQVLDQRVPAHERREELFSGHAGRIVGPGIRTHRPCLVIAGPNM